MIMNRLRLMVAVLSVALILPLGGCVMVVAGVGGAGTVGYIRGELKTTESASLNKVWRATLKGVRSQKLALVNKKKNSTSAEITARTAKDEKVKITMKKLAKNKTEVRIRVGVFGDQALSISLHDKIKSYL